MKSSDKDVPSKLVLHVRDRVFVEWHCCVSFQLPLRDMRRLISTERGVNLIGEVGRESPEPGS